jgi:hypothetical protein
MSDLLTLPWLFATTGGVVILGVIIAYGMTRARHRSPREKQQRDAGTRKLYREE